MLKIKVSLSVCEFNKQSDWIALTLENKSIYDNKYYLNLVLKDV